ncbi:MAG: N-acetylmuramate alpha-1-phosphate uridylyltransferase MurU [Acidiferrobacterales bacterium]
MKAMILAAGRGERLRPLTDETPKPLLKVGNRPLIVHLIKALASAGLDDLVINHAHLGKQIVDTLADGADLGVRIRYSPEPPDALETGGGVLNALPLLDSDPFVVVNGDIWTDYPFKRLPRRLSGLAHLVLVDNPPHHRLGDFALKVGRVRAGPSHRLTFSGIGVYTHALFQSCSPGRFALAPLLRSAIAQDQVTGEHYKGEWIDVGTPEQWRELDEQISGQ